MSSRSNWSATVAARGSDHVAVHDGRRQVLAEIDVDAVQLEFPDTDGTAPSEERCENPVAGTAERLIAWQRKPVLELHVRDQRSSLLRTSMTQ